VLEGHRHSHHADAVQPLDELGPTLTAAVNPMTEAATVILPLGVQRARIGHGA
jgi:hypothetical protein